MKREYKTWKEAIPDLAALKFDLGQSSNAIREMFDQGFMLKYDTKMNFYYWTIENDNTNM